MQITKINGRDVPVEEAPASVVVFTGGANPSDETGPFAFWTCLYDTNGRTMGNIARCPIRFDAGERFRWFEGESAPAWLSRISRVRPSTAAEIEAWARESNHPADMAHATTAEIGGAKYRWATERGKFVAD